jgi:hypothetical protein
MMLTTPALAASCRPRADRVTAYAAGDQHQHAGRVRARLGVHVGVEDPGDEEPDRRTRRPGRWGATAYLDAGLRDTASILESASAEVRSPDACVFDNSKKRVAGGRRTGEGTPACG